MASIHEVAKVSEGISVIVGGPSKNDTGKEIYILPCNNKPK